MPCVLLLLAAAASGCAQQSALPFEVSNPGNKKWPPKEAVRIYNSACDILAHTIRPEKPPVLRPNFRLVLGAESDQFVNEGGVTEVHLKSWDAEKFAEGVVVVAVRDLLRADELARVVHQSVSLAAATVDVHELARQ
ncbi:MAG TPA: hypothetical protein VKR57_12890 [Terriglobales bacterium]|nr:hypothetical protein [Terriglobales bacterium]